MKPCLLIPCYDHGATLGSVLSSLEPLHLPCFVIDDGSDEMNRQRIRSAAAGLSWVCVERCERNGGRGAALRRGYRLAARDGFTHVLQVDADGQFEAADVPSVLEVARRHPESLVLGVPVFDRSAPGSRRYGRWISRGWVWLETLSFAVADPLCGLRCLPVAPLARLLDRTPCGNGMEFDTELAVRLVWAGLPVENVPVRVRYPEGGTSHFRLVRDNLRIGWLHTRLFITLWKNLAQKSFGRSRR